MSLRLKIILTVSLILNVFLVGIGIGVLVTGARLTPAQAAKRPVPNIWLASEALPPPDRTAFRTMLRQEAASVQPELKSVRLARREAAALIAQPNYDPVVVQATLQRARDGEMHARGEIDAAFAAYLVKLTHKQRADMAEALVRARPNAVRNAVKTEGAEPAAAP